MVLTLPSDHRFREGASSVDLLVERSSAATDELIEDMPVLVADSDEPYRCHLPLASSCQRSRCVEDGPLRSKTSVPLDDRLESSSSTVGGWAIFTALATDPTGSWAWDVI